MSDEDKGKIILPGGGKLTPVYPQAVVTQKLIELEENDERLAMAVMGTIQNAEQGFYEAGLLTEWIAAVVLDDDPEGEARTALAGYLADRRDTRAEAEYVEGHPVLGEEPPTPPEAS